MLLTIYNHNNCFTSRNNLVISIALHVCLKRKINKVDRAAIFNHFLSRVCKLTFDFPQSSPEKLSTASPYST